MDGCIRRELKSCSQKSKFQPFPLQEVYYMLPLNTFICIHYSSRTNWFIFSSIKTRLHFTRELLYCWGCRKLLNYLQNTKSWIQTQYSILILNCNKHHFPEPWLTHRLIPSSQLSQVLGGRLGVLVFVYFIIATQLGNLQSRDSHHWLHFLLNTTGNENQKDWITLYSQ